MNQKILEEKIQQYYASGREADRLVSLSTGGLIEAQEVRKELVKLQPESRILDIGGGTGVHAAWLTEQGHEVTLLDPVAKHIELAQEHGTFEAVLGDARELPFEDESFDVVLMFGPLYHLIDVEDRKRALHEAHRVLKANGTILSAGVSRISAFLQNVLAAPDLTPEHIDTNPLYTGHWVNSGDGYPGGHFHTAKELENELSSSGFAEISTRGLELSLVFEIYPANQELAALVSQVQDTMKQLDPEGKRQKLAADLSPHIFASGVKKEK